MQLLLDAAVTTVLPRFRTRANLCENRTHQSQGFTRKLSHYTIQKTKIQGQCLASFHQGLVSCGLMMMISVSAPEAIRHNLRSSLSGPWPMLAVASCGFFEPGVARRFFFFLTSLLVAYNVRKLARFMFCLRAADWLKPGWESFLSNIVAVLAKGRH